jgi:hypothetical protein
MLIGSMANSVNETSMYNMSYHYYHLKGNEYQVAACKERHIDIIYIRHVVGACDFAIVSKIVFDLLLSLV